MHRLRLTSIWHRLPMEMVKSRSLEVFEKRGDVALKDVVNGHGGDRLGLNLVILEVFSNLYDSMICHLPIYKKGI